MKIPQIPTDNLYKFKAIIGVILAIAATIFTLGKMMELEIQTIDLGVQVEMLKINQNYISENLKYLETKKIPTTEDLLVIRQKRLEFEENTQEIRGNISKTDLNLRNVKLLIVICFLGIIIGYLMAKSGFKDWLIKVQKPQDKILELQLNALNSEISKLDSTKDS